MTDDTSPAFSPDGKYLYFASERSFQPRFGPYDQVPLWSETTCLYLVTLQADAPHPFPPESDEVAVADGEDGKDGDETDDGKKDDEKKDGEGRRSSPRSSTSRASATASSPWTCRPATTAAWPRPRASCST